MYVLYIRFIFFFSEVIKMKLGKNALMMALGAGAVLAYQKYNKPVMKKMEKTADKMIRKADKKLEDMM